LRIRNAILKIPGNQAPSSLQCSLGINSLRIFKVLAWHSKPVIWEFFLYGHHEACTNDQSTMIKLLPSSRQHAKLKTTKQKISETLRLGIYTYKLWSKIQKFNIINASHTDKENDIKKLIGTGWAQAAARAREVWIARRRRKSQAPKGDLKWCMKTLARVPAPGSPTPTPVNNINGLPPSAQAAASITQQPPFQLLLRELIVRPSDEESPPINYNSILSRMVAKTLYLIQSAFHKCCTYKVGYPTTDSMGALNWTA
jgi:hypothetical protein